jgi:thiamine-phosphate pyrophosphorylase
MHNNIPKLFQFIESFETNLIKNRTKNLGIIYRNYSNKINETSLIKYKKFCEKNNIKLYLANNINLAIKLMLSGVYLPAFNKKKIIKKFKLRKNFQILGSAHNLIEINRKIEQGCEIIFLAPLFKTKKSKNHLNIIKFNILTLNKKVKFVALGGIKKNNISKTKMLNICGISGISMFQKKTGL